MRSAPRHSPPPSRRASDALRWVDQPMKIVVPIKQVAVADDELQLLDDGARADPDSLEWELNEWDRFSLEAAVQIRDAVESPESEVLALSVCDERAEDGLRAALASGADRAVRIWDDTLEEADPLAVARVLASAIAPESPDLVLCGAQSSDAVNSATGVALAGYLGLPRVAVVRRIELDGASAAVERELEGGVIELLRVGLPALLTVQTGINEPRYATLRAIKQARVEPLVVLAPSDLDLGRDDLLAAAGWRRRRLAHPERGARAAILDGSTAEVAARIVSIIRERLG